MSHFFDGKPSAALSAESENDDVYLDAFETLQTNDVIANSCHQLLQAIGEDPNREGLLKTPHRFAKAWQHLTSGYHQSLDQIVNDALFEADNEDIVLVRGIEIFSMCEHHLLPFWGHVHIAYIPDGKVIGLSKLPRIADMFARRLQLQERLTEQIADAVDEILRPRGVAVVAECQHMCMMMRGV
ncbi:MAG: GTP cyclohydrolase I FolE, partial [Planctomycetes bacterium]|nr:GTP cyclohydrolase I FolE [Planctomycetota bacterium]